MQLSSQLLFFFSALGAFNGIVLAAFLLLAKPSNTTTKLLATLLLMVSLRISKSVWFYFNPELGKQFLQLGLSACMLIGPLLYFYVASANQQLNQLKFNWSQHLIGVVVLIVLVGVLWPYQTNTELWGDVIYRVINLAWGGYLIATGIMLFPRLFVWLGDHQALDKEQLLSVNVYFAVCLVWLAYFTASYTSYIVGALSFSFILYITIMVWQFKLKHQPKRSYENKVIATDVVEDLTNTLSTLMNDESVFTNPNLTLPELAKRCRVSVAVLSQYLNDNLNKSFAHYINEFRIEEAKRLLVNNKNLTIEHISELAGYNSQSTFYSAFKQFANTTPAKYRQQFNE